MDQLKKVAKQIPIRHNVSIRVIDPTTGDIVSEHTGHNAATNSLVTGIAHYLKGDGVLNQGYHMLSSYVPMYISLGTMGLINQESDSEGLPSGIGIISYKDKYPNDPDLEEANRFVDYLTQTPGYGADGYDPNENNGREYLGLGPMFEDRVYKEITQEILQIGDINFDGKVDYQDVMLLVDYNCGVKNLSEKQLFVAQADENGSVSCEMVQKVKDCAEGKILPSELGTAIYQPKSAPTVNCELISESFPRTKIAFRDIVPETEAEFPQTVDVVYSAMISTGALSQFRETDKDYIYITEAGLWSKPDWSDGGDNGLLAGYRISPPNSNNWKMAEWDTQRRVYFDSPECKENRRILKQNIIKVKRNQIVQVVWKIQIGGMDQLGGIMSLYPHYSPTLKWINWD